MLIVVPTLGQRVHFLEQTLASLADQLPRPDVIVVAPAAATRANEIAARLGARTLVDPGGQAAAINLGMSAAERSHEFVNWIGDDDLLEPGSIAATVRALDQRADAVVAYGACRYVDRTGNQLWISRAGRWAPRILAWGPDLIPQPGMLIRRVAWDEVQGLDEAMRFAFDLDLLLKLRAVGAFVDVGAVVSSFRWHPDSLTVSDRSRSLAESRLARRRALSPGMRRLAWSWEGPVDLATRLAAAEVTRRARRRQSQGGAI